MREHVGDFVESAEVLERRNDLHPGVLLAREEEIVEAMGGDLPNSRMDEWGPMRWEKLHSYHVRAQLTDAKWAEHLRPGLEFGTSAYDVWFED